MRWTVWRLSHLLIFLHCQLVFIVWLDLHPDIHLSHFRKNCQFLQLTMIFEWRLIALWREEFYPWTWKFVTTWDVAVPTTAYWSAVPTTATDGVRPRELGRYRKSYELGGQVRSEGQWWLADWPWSRCSGHFGEIMMFTPTKDPFNAGLFFACKRAIFWKGLNAITGSYLVYYCRGRC